MSSSIAQLVFVTTELYQLLVGSLWASFCSWKKQLPLIHQYKAFDLSKHSRHFELNSDQCTWSFQIIPTESRIFLSIYQLHFLQNILFLPERSHRHDSKLTLLTYYYCANRKQNHQIYFFSHQFSWGHPWHLYTMHEGHRKGHKQLYWVSIISMSLLPLLVLNKHHDWFFTL